MATTVVLGAGFGVCAGLPRQEQIMENLIAPVVNGTRELESRITDILRDWLKKAFHWSGDEKTLPTLEDYFTCLDLSANSGHHLGNEFQPKKLRAIRRLSIYRVLKVINEKSYGFNQQAGDSEIAEFLEKIFSRDTEFHFVLTNWDVVLERRLTHLHRKWTYGIHCQNLDGNLMKSRPDDVGIYKMHGSSNWLYCENCSSLFYDRDRKVVVSKKVGVLLDDILLFYPNLTDNERKKLNAEMNTQPVCRSCGVSLSSHMVTFSFRKAFRTIFYPAVWSHAQRALIKSDKWIFAGYSLPDADVEFKHLLKSAELVESVGGQSDRQIHVIINEREETLNRYRRFFGSNIREENMQKGGIKAYTANTSI
jgi:NAD-dependent SIR2 family protein deacetylase